MKLFYLHETGIESEKANLVQVVQMCHAFANNGLDVVLALPGGKRIRSQKEYSEIVERMFGIEMNFSIVTFRKLTIGNRLSLIGGYFGVKRILKKIDCDLCFTRNSLYASLVLKKKIPVIYESHNSLVHSGSKILNRFWHRRLIKDAKNDKLIGFVTISHALADFWAKQGVPPEKISALHSGVNKQPFQGTAGPNFLRKKMAIPANKKIVMYIGSLYSDRGIDAVIDLAVIFPQTVFIVVGGPEPKRREYEKLSKGKCKGENIRFIGRISHLDVPRYLQCADILLMIWTNQVKTINYCSPLKTFEYMASGRLIVGHAFPTIKEVLDDGKTALLADPDSFESLRMTLEKAMALGEADKIGRQAREKVFESYTWDRRAMAIIHMLKRVKNKDSLVNV